MMMIPKRNNFYMLDDLFQDSFFTQQENCMKVDIKETETEYILIVDLPGYSKENVKVSVEDGYLSIQASLCKETNEANDEKYIRRERYYGECKRNFYIGDTIKPEDINASFKNGTLQIKVPKKVEAKKINPTKYVQITD